MKRRLRRAMLFAIALTEIAIAGSCSKPKKNRTLYLPASGTEINIQLDFPVAFVGTKEDFGFVCGGAQGLLVSIDTGTAATPVWSYRFLVGLDGQLWGCADSSQPCPDQRILTQIGRPSRIAVEGIDRSPADYSVSATSNVVCRGVADAIVQMGQMDVVAVPTPSPQTSPPLPLVTLIVDATIPMLRVGDVNPTYSTAGPYGQGAASAALPSIARKSTGGQILITSGNGGTSTYVFRPWTIAASPDAAKLATGRTLFFSTGFLDSAGNAAVLVGPGTGSGEIKSVEILRPGADGSIVLNSYNLTTFSQSVPLWLPEHKESAVRTPAVFFVGGCYYNGSTETFNARQEFFFPSAPTDLATCAPGSTVGSPAMCSSGANAMGDNGHCGMPVGVSRFAGTSKIFMAPGYANAFGNINNHSYLFDPETKIYEGPLTTRGSPPVLGRSAVEMSGGEIAFFGGFDSTGNYTKKWGLFDPVSKVVVEGGGTLATSRASHLQSLLSDGSVFIAGGNGAADSRSVEIFRPVFGTTNGTFSFPVRSFGSCATGVEPECVRLSFGRIQAISERIDGSATWLNGAIVIAAGSAIPSQHIVELYVPAYSCNGTLPVSVRGTPLSDVDFCDRERVREGLTNPANP